MENFLNPENNPNEKPRILDPEIKDQAESNKVTIETLGKIIEQDIQQITDEFKFIEKDTDQIEYMKSQGDMFSAEEIEDVKKRIEEAQQSIKEIKSSVADLILLRASFQHFEDELVALDQKFKDLLLKIEPKNLN